MYDAILMLTNILPHKSKPNTCMSNVNDEVFMNKHQLSHQFAWKCLAYPLLPMDVQTLFSRIPSGLPYKIYLPQSKNVCITYTFFSYTLQPYIDNTYNMYLEVCFKVFIIHKNSKNSLHSVWNSAIRAHTQSSNHPQKPHLLNTLKDL